MKADADVALLLASHEEEKAVVKWAKVALVVSGVAVLIWGGLLLRSAS